MYMMHALSVMTKMSWSVYIGIIKQTSVSKLRRYICVKEMWVNLRYIDGTWRR